MRIAVVAGQFPVISETFVLNQITGLIDRGHDVEILANDPGISSKMHPDVEKYGLLARTYYWGGGGVRKRTAARHIAKAVLGAKPAEALRLVKKSFGASKEMGDPWSARLVQQALLASSRAPYDVILCHFGTIGRQVQALRDMGALQGRLATVFHGYDMSVFVRERGMDVYQRLLERGELALPISEHWQDLLLEMGADKDRVIVHRMGIDCAKFSFKERVLDENDPQQSVRLVTIARLVEKKGVEYVIRAVARLVARYPQIQYEIVGNGPLEASLKALVVELGVQRNVRFLGWMEQAEIIKVLEQQHILVIPSVTAANGDKEGLPVVIMEGMAMGLPVVSTYHSGIPELVVDGVTGYLVEERNVEQLMDRLEALVSAPEKWAEMGCAGRKAVEENFDIERLNDRLEVLLQELAEA